MRRLARRTFSSLMGREGRSYVVGTLGVILGLGLMFAPAVLMWHESPLVPPGSTRSIYLGIAGQLLASASGFLLGVPIARRRRREQRIEAGQCPTCGYDLRATPGRCP